MSFVLLATQLFSQQNARNGCYYAPTGEIKMFVVFADVVNDTFSDPIPNWQPGCHPEYASEIIDDNTKGSLVSYISRYYNEFSFGTFQVTGDYYPYLLEFKSRKSFQILQYLSV